MIAVSGLFLPLMVTPLISDFVSERLWIDTGLHRYIRTRKLRRPSCAAPPASFTQSFATPSVVLNRTMYTLAFAVCEYSVSTAGVTPKKGAYTGLKSDKEISRFSAYSSNSRALLVPIPEKSFWSRSRITAFTRESEELSRMVRIAAAVSPSKSRVGGTVPAVN